MGLQLLSIIFNFLLKEDKKNMMGGNQEDSIELLVRPPVLCLPLFVEKFYFLWPFSPSYQEYVKLENEKMQKLKEVNYRKDYNSLLLNETLSQIKLTPLALYRAYR